VRDRADYCMFAAEMAALTRRKIKKTWQYIPGPLKFAGADAQLLRDKQRIYALKGLQSMKMRLGGRLRCRLREIGYRLGVRLIDARGCRHTLPGHH
jgi:hypothetical protein